MLCFQKREIIRYRYTYDDDDDDDVDDEWMNDYMCDNDFILRKI